MNPLRILVIHNRYQQRGGEDEVVESEMQLLSDQGHEVELYQRDNHEIAAQGAVRTAAGTIWSGQSWRAIQAELTEFVPDLVHVHNTFPLISPSVYWGASRVQVPVVQTLHNFRLFCVQAMFLRNGEVCEDCLGSGPWRGVMRGCYRGSRPQSGALALSLAAHRVLGTFRTKVARYIALNQFCRRKFVEGGLPAERIRVKPNFVDIPRPEPAQRSGALFVGRLSHEKGADVLGRALTGLPGPGLKVIGVGPQARHFENRPGVECLGWQDQAAVYTHMRRAAYLVMPSVWYENFPRTLVEAFASGLPVIASRIGALAELIEPGRTGLLFEPGSPDSLREALAWAHAHPEEMRQMGVNARRVYEREYTPERNYQQLMSIYGEALGSVSDRVRKAG